MNIHAPSIRGRILRLLVPLSALACFAAALAIFLLTREELQETQAGQMLSLAQAAARLHGQQLLPTGPGEDEEAEAHSEDYLLRGFSADGQLRYDSHPNLPSAALDQPIQRWHGERWRVHVYSTAEGDRWLLAHRQEESNELIGQWLLAALLPLGAVLLLAGLAIVGVVSFGLSPLNQLSTALAQRHPTQLDPLPEDNAEPLELRPIRRALNQLFQRIQQFLQRERQFIDDAAHELRTPLTIVKAQCQAMDVERLDADSRQRFAHILTGIERADTLSTRLLAQARAEQPVGEASQLSVNRLLQQQLAEWIPLAETRQLQVSLEAERDVELCGVAEDFRAIVGNLLSNALKYVPEGAEVCVRLDPQQLSVEDSGAGISSEQREAVFARFARLTNDDKGTGLGLSIARALAERNRWRLWVERSERLGGARFVLAWGNLKTP